MKSAVRYRCMISELHGSEYDVNGAIVNVATLSLNILHVVKMHWKTLNPVLVSLRCERVQ